MKIAIYGKIISEAHTPFIQQLFDKLAKEKIQCLIFEPFAEFLRSINMKVSSTQNFSSYNDLNKNVNFLISIGGDGTFLDTIALVRNSNIPVVGINTGRLGFLSNISKEDIALAIEELVKGNFTLEKRSLLRLETQDNLFGDVNFALNDITIHKHDSTSMITTHVYLNNEFLNSYWSDGLIIATPTGSTAYSLSCGGPIITPETGNFIINPVAPHNLNVRPIVISDDNKISIKVESRSEKFLLSLDSRSETIDTSVEFNIYKEKFCLNLLRLNNQGFLSTLRTKLMWGLDKRN